MSHLMSFHSNEMAEKLEESSTQTSVDESSKFPAISLEWNRLKLLIVTVKQLWYITSSCTCNMPYMSHVRWILMVMMVKTTTPISRSSRRHQNRYFVIVLSEWPLATEIGDYSFDNICRILPFRTCFLNVKYTINW